jgi:hypothetical protein
MIGPRMLLTLGLGLLFAPISVAAYKYVPPHLRGAAVGLASLLRTEGGSVGTSLATTIQERREQFHVARLGEHLNPFASPAGRRIETRKDAPFPCPRPHCRTLLIRFSFDAGRPLATIAVGLATYT